MTSPELPTTVDGVLERLERCLETARAENSADAYFLLIYIWETRDIAAAAATFDAPDELRRMIVVFARRYFEARRRFREGAPTTRVWELAFGAARSSSALVVQHLLLAMNAHINVDLAPAAAETNLSWSDYARVGAVLERSVAAIQRRLNRTTLALRALDLLAGDFDEMFSTFSLKAARRHAFELAQRLRAAPEPARGALLAEADDFALRLGQRLLSPPWRDRLLLAAVRLSERKLSPRELLALLERA